MSKLRTSVHNINIWMKWIMDELRPRCTLGWTLLAVSCEMCECSQVDTSAPRHLGSVGTTAPYTRHYEDHPPRSTTHSTHTHHTASHCFIFVRKCLLGVVFRHGHQLICLIKVVWFWCSKMKRRFLQLHTLMSRLQKVEMTLFHLILCAHVKNTLLQTNYVHEDFLTKINQWAGRSCWEINRDGRWSSAKHRHWYYI